jgi:hypothetical protein
MRSRTMTAACTPVAATSTQVAIDGNRVARGPASSSGPRPLTLLRIELAFINVRGSWVCARDVRPVPAWRRMPLALRAMIRVPTVSSQAIVLPRVTLGAGTASTRRRYVMPGTLAGRRRRSAPALSEVNARIRRTGSFRPKIRAATGSLVLRCCAPYKKGAVQGNISSVHATRCAVLEGVNRCRE